MEIIEDMQIGNGGREKIDMFHPVDDVIFCSECGKKYLKNEVNGKCIECDGIYFIKGTFASVLAGYLELDRKSMLKKYYETRYRKDSVIKMNNRRIIIRLLMMDRLLHFNDIKTQDAVMKIMNYSKRELRNSIS